MLKAMAPPGSTIRVDGFTGGRLPPKSQIRSIRLPRMDMFAAQNHGGMGGAHFIDIMTMPGAGPLRGSVDFTFLDDALNARNAMTPRRATSSCSSTASRCRARSSRTGRLLAVGRAEPRSTSRRTSYAVLPGGSASPGRCRQPQDRLNLSAGSTT